MRSTLEIGSVEQTLNWSEITPKTIIPIAEDAQYTEWMKYTFQPFSQTQLFYSWSSEQKNEVCESSLIQVIGGEFSIETSGLFIIGNKLNIWNLGQTSDTGVEYILLWSYT